MNMSWETETAIIGEIRGKGYQTMAQGRFVAPEPFWEVDLFGIRDEWCVRGWARRA